MFDSIISYASTGMLMLLSLFAFVLLVGCLYPRWAFKPSYKILNIKDRGIKRYTFPGGRAISYQPALYIRPYIKSYLLYSREGKKYFKCELTASVDAMEYELVAFDCEDRVIAVLQISDQIVQKGNAKTVLLPQATSYVTLILRSVNDQKISKSPVACYSKARILVYFAAVTVTVMAEMYLLRYGVLYFFNVGFSKTSGGDIVMLATTLTGGVFYSSISSLFHRAKYTKIGHAR